MNGLYNNLTSNSLYGKNLSYELIDVISKRYAPLAKSTYLTSLNSWGYAEENVSKALESTWATAYTTILNCNVILENLATQQGILSPAENYWPSGLSFISTCYAYSAPSIKRILRPHPSLTTNR